MSRGILSPNFHAQNKEKPFVQCREKSPTNQQTNQLMVTGPIPNKRINDKCNHPQHKCALPRDHRFLFLLFHFPPYFLLGGWLIG